MEKDRPSAESKRPAGSGEHEGNAGTRSEAALTPKPDQQEADGRFSVSEEQNFDEQPDQARHVGDMPQDADAPGKPADAMAKSMQEEGKGEQGKARLKQAVERAVLPQR